MIDIESLFIHDHKIKAGIVLVTPDIAREFLQTIEDRGDDITTKQRVANKRKIAEVTQQLASGLFHTNGESIIISDKGYLLDGQTRCWGVIKSGVCAEILVASGIEEDAMPTIDQGRARSHADVVSMGGYPMPLARIIGGAGAIEARMREYGHPIDSPNRVIRAKDTPADVLALVRSDDELVRSGEWIHQYRKQRGHLYPLAWLAWLNYRFNRVDQQFTDNWLDDFILGSNLSSNDPRLWIRARILRERSSSMNTSSLVRACWLIRAWDRSRRGRAYMSESGLFSSISVHNELARIKLEGDK